MLRARGVTARGGNRNAFRQSIPRIFEVKEQCIVKCGARRGIACRVLVDLAFLHFANFSDVAHRQYRCTNERHRRKDV